MPFQFGMPLTRFWKDDSGEMHFEGVASSMAVDSQKERLSKDGLESMTAWRGIDLLPSHKAGALDELGTVDEGRVDGDQFVVKGTLDPTNPQAVRLYERMASGHQYELSVGGKITKAHYELQKDGQRVRVVDGCVLDHIAVCRPGKASNPDTYLQVMAKAMDDDGQWPEAAPEERGDDMMHGALAKMEEELKKAGARHSKADITALHKAMDLMRETCGCADCAAAISAAGDVVEKADSVSYSENKRSEQVERALNSFMWDAQSTLRETLETIMSGDAGDKRALCAAALDEFKADVLTQLALPPEQPTVLALEDTPAAAVAIAKEAAPMSEATEAPVTGQEVVEKADEMPEWAKSLQAQVDELAKASADKDEKITDLEKQVADGADALAKERAEVERLKALPVAGGPVNTAATTDETTIAKADDETPFAKSAREAREATGQREQTAARRAASSAIADEIVGRAIGSR